MISKVYTINQVSQGQHSKLFWLKKMQLLCFIQIVVCLLTKKSLSFFKFVLESWRTINNLNNTQNAYQLIFSDHILFDNILGYTLTLWCLWFLESTPARLISQVKFFERENFNPTCWSYKVKLTYFHTEWNFSKKYFVHNKVEWPFLSRTYVKNIYTAKSNQFCFTGNHYLLFHFFFATKFTVIIIYRQFNELNTKRPKIKGFNGLLTDYTMW